MGNTEKYIIIANPLDDTVGDDQQEWRDDSRLDRLKRVAVSELKESVHEFIESAKEIFDEIDAELKRYELAQIELTATITVSGKLSWVVTSTEGGVEGGIKFVFKRKADS